MCRLFTPQSNHTFVSTAVLMLPTRNQVKLTNPCFLTVRVPIVNGEQLQNEAP